MRVLFASAAALALLVVTLGAYVRLKDAGLGCPDWPGCYGQIVGVPDTDEVGAQIDRAKAWIEVTHRYAAAILGILVLAITALAWKEGRHRILATAILVLVIFQAILGALTVTELLKPAIVTSHLLGGMAILALLTAAACAGLSDNFRPLGQRTKALVGVVALALACQIALGGWVSSNYAGLACGTSFPSCSGSWSPVADTSAFTLGRELGKDAAGGPITQQALAYVQWVHRIGALALTVAVCALAAALFLQGRKGQAIVLFALLLTQLTLGIYIVTHLLPLAGSLLHNTVAALLCVALAHVALSAGASGNRT